MTTYDFKVRRGDTFSGATFTITVNGSPFDFFGGSVKAMFRRGINLAPALTLTNGSGFTIVDGHNGVLQLNAQVFTLEPGDYLYDIQITRLDGLVKTYIGGTMTVLQDVTT